MKITCGEGLFHATLFPLTCVYKPVGISFAILQQFPKLEILNSLKNSKNSLLGFISMSPYILLFCNNRLPTFTAPMLLWPPPTLPHSPAQVETFVSTQAQQGEALTTGQAGLPPQASSFVLGLWQPVSLLPPPPPLLPEISVSLVSQPSP